MRKPRYKAVFVSPHLDDAVFSCGGEISRLTKDGPVLVLNIFTRYLSEVKIRAVVLGAERYEEELAAAEYLGFVSHNLGALDVSFRRKAYRSLGNIFRPPVLEDLGDYLAGLRDLVFGYLSEIDYQYLYVPLAIGWHVDHLLTHLIFEPWIGRNGLVHYEDAPYCLIPNATRYRLDELGSYTRAETDLTLVPTNKWAAWWDSTVGYSGTALMRNLRPGIIRWLAVPTVGVYLYRLMSMHRRISASTPRRLELQPLLKLLDNGAFARKFHAMALYRSQFQEFFSGPRDCENFSRSYSRKIQPDVDLLERFWLITPIL